MKKLISLLLALVMVFTFTVVPAMAEEAGDVTEPEVPEVPAEPASVVYYVGDAQEGEAVADLLSGEAYMPDRMPEAAAAEGDYFVGWADAEGNLVGKNGLALAAGENKLTAVYASYEAEKAVDLSKHADSEVYIGYMKNGEYFGYVDARTSGSPKVEYVTDEETGESYLQVIPSAANAGDTAFSLADANGAVIQGKWETKYNIVVEYRIPENDGAVSLRANFGGKIYDATVDYNQAPLFRNEWGNACGLVKQGNFWSVDAASGLEKKWHDNGGYYYRFGDNVENAATTDGWKKVTFTGTTGAADANYLPLFMLDVSVGTNAQAQKVQIKSVTVVDTTIENIKPATVEYVVDGETVATVADLVAGEAYIPDRMPEAEAPAGKYFAGWKNAYGNWAGKDGFVLEAGVNKLTAVYNDVVYSTTTSGDLVIGDDGVLAYPSYDVNGENYMNYLDATGNYLGFEPTLLDGEKVWRMYNKATWAGRATFVLPNADGSAMAIEPGQSYNITMTYKVPDYKGSTYLLFGGGLGFYDQTGTYRDERPALSTSFQNIVKNVVNFKSTTDPNLPSNSTGWTWTLTSAGHHQWAVQGASSEWQTVTFSLSTSADYTNFLPVIVGAFSLPGLGEMYIKEFKVKNTVAVDPATVVVMANGEVEETVENLKEGDTFVIDRFPNAETPEGKYFAGWKLNGKYVVDAVELGAGENVIEAVYKDYVTGEVSADLKEANLPKTSDGKATKVILPSIVEDVYQNHVLSGGWTRTEDATDETGDYLRYYTNDGWGSNSLKVLRDADGAALMAKPETEYEIKVTYRLGKFPETYTATWEDYQNGGTRASMMMYAMVGFDPTIRNKFENGNGQTGAYGKATPTEHATWYDHGYGLGLWTDVCADGWVTETFKITTKSLEQYAADGYIPVFTICTGVSSNAYEVHIKDVTISEHVHEWVEDPDNNKAPTCAEAGKIAYKCECGKTKFEDGEAATGEHDYSVNDGLTCAGCKNSLAPVAPITAEISFNYVKLTAFEGLEYSIDGETWQTSVLFAGLTAETEYTFYQRVAASDVANVGAISEALVVTTLVAPDTLPGDVDGSGAVNAADLATLKKLIAGLIENDDPSVVNPDVDNSGSAKPNAADLAALKKIIAGLV